MRVYSGVPRGPKRIQRKRTKGWRTPEGAVYVGRPSAWGNPFPLDGDWITWKAVALGYRADARGRRQLAVSLYEAWITDSSVVSLPLEDDGGVIEFTSGHAVPMAQHARDIAYGASVLFDAPLLREPPNLEPLRGCDLVCWCPPSQLCHADVLLEIANGDSGVPQ